MTFPRLADGDAEALPEIIDEGVRWTCRDLIPPLVYRLAEDGQAAGGQGTERGRGNAELYRFIHEIRSRQQRLSRLLVRAIASGDPRRWRPGGLYLAATGADAVRQQGFAGGIFPQLLAMQDDVWWTREALAEDATCRRWTRAGYVGMALLVAIIAAARCCRTPSYRGRIAGEVSRKRVHGSLGRKGRSAQKSIWHRI